MPTGTDADPAFGTAVRAALCLSTCEVDFWRVVRRDDHEGAVFPVVSLWTVARGALPWVAGVLLVVLAWGYVERLQRARDSALAGQAATMQALGNESAAREAVTAALVRADRVMAAREAEIRTLEATVRARRAGLYEAMAQPESVPWAAARVPAAVLDRLREAAADRDHAGRDPDAAERAHD